MNVAVCVKVVPDTAARIQVQADGSGIETAGIKWVVSPYDEFAIEEAAQIVEAKAADKALLFTIGDKGTALSPLRKGGLAVGGDELYLIDDAAIHAADNLGKARAFVASIQGAGDVQLVLAGKQTTDDDDVQIPAMVAELLGWPLVTVVDEFWVEGTSFKATRNVGGGVREVVTGSLPVVVTCDKGLNTPRYAKLPQITKAKRKPVHEQSAGDLGLADLAPKATASAYGEPPPRPAGRKLDGDVDSQVAQLVTALRDEAKVL